MALCLLLLAAPVCAAGEMVTRACSTTTPAGGGEITFSLEVAGIGYGGIVETLPSEFTFISTTHPAEQYRVQGQNIAFSLINDTKIEYTIKVPDSGCGQISGIWEDFATGNAGQIAPVMIAVNGEVCTGGVDTVGSVDATPVPAQAGCGLIVVPAILLCALFFSYLRRDRR